MINYGCADCRAKSCHLGDGNYPGFCPGQDLPEELINDVMKEYDDLTVRRIAIAAAETESENYCKMTRVEETVEFARKIGAKRIGLAHCVGLIAEAGIMARILRKNGFEVVSVSCKCGEQKKGDIGISPECHNTKYIMQILEFGTRESPIVLIQPVDDHDLSVIDAEVRAIRELAKTDFRLIAVKVDSWNHDLSPWKADAVFGNADFGDGAQDTLKEILNLTGDPSMTYYIGGYSLAGLFALWAGYQTDIFAGVAAASPSMWFPGFVEYMKSHDIRTGRVYLSLGDREEKTRNRIMATVGDCIREAYTLLQDRGVMCTLEWNKGNHFKDPDIRTAKAFADIIHRS